MQENHLERARVTREVVAAKVTIIDGASNAKARLFHPLMFLL